MDVAAITWLLAAQLVVDLVLVVLLAFFVWRARVLMDTLAKTARGGEWTNGKLAEAFESIAQSLTSSAASIQLSATGSAASAVAIQLIARELRPMADDQHVDLADVK